MYIKIEKFKINKRCYYIKMNNFIFSSLVYYLSLQRCSTYNDFSIHGLWPDYINGGYPQFCTNQQFNLSTIEPILDDLNKH